MHKEQWYSLLPPELMEGVTKYGSEWVWPREEALRIADWLHVNGYIMTSVETWFPTLPGPSPLLNDWSEARSYPSPPFPMSAPEFIATFIPDPVTEQIAGLDVVFNISAKRA